MRANDSFFVTSDIILMTLQVFYQAGTTSSSDSSVVFVDGNQDGVVINNLSPGTPYDIRVEAYTQDGMVINIGSIHIVTSGIVAKFCCCSNTRFVSVFANRNLDGIASPRSNLRIIGH